MCQGWFQFLRYREKKVYRKLHPTTVSESVSSIEGNIECGRGGRGESCALLCGYFKYRYYIVTEKMMNNDAIDFRRWERCPVGGSVQK